MLDSSQVRRNASSANIFDTVNPTSLFGTGMWSEQDMGATQAPEVVSPQQYNAPAPSRSVKEKDFCIPSTPLRKERGQSFSNMALSNTGMVTPQSSRSFSTTALSYTPGQNYGSLMSPMDTPLATPSEGLQNALLDYNIESGFKPGPWTYPTELPNSKTGFFDSEQALNAEFNAAPGDLLEESSYMQAFFESGDRAGSVMSSLDGSIDGFDSVESLGGKCEQISFPNYSSFSTPASRHQSISRSRQVSFSVEPSQSARERNASLGEHCNTSPPLGSALGHHPTCNGQSGNSVNANNASHGGNITPTPGGGVNPYYNPPSFMRRSQSVIMQRGVVDRTTPLELGSAYDAGIRSFELGGLENTPRRNSASGPSPTATLASQTIQGHQSQVSHQQHQHLQGNGDASVISSSSYEDASGEKPFTCETCDKSFRRMEHLRRHIKTHTQERPYQCSIATCNRRFSRTDNLKAHILTHAKKSGRNVYVEGLADRPDIQLKRRKPRKPSASNISG